MQEARDNFVQCLGVTLISHLTMANQVTEANQRIRLLEERLARLEERGRTARQRARRTGASVGREMGSREDPIILLDDEDRLAHGLPPAPGPARPDTPLPGLGRRISPPPVPVPPPRSERGVTSMQQGLGERPAPRIRRLTPEERANWLRPINSESEDDIYR